MDYCSGENILAEPYLAMILSYLTIKDIYASVIRLTKKHYRIMDENIYRIHKERVKQWIIRDFGDIFKIYPSPILIKQFYDDMHTSDFIFNLFNDYNFLVQFANCSLELPSTPTTTDINTNAPHLPTANNFYNNNNNNNNNVGVTTGGISNTNTNGLQYKNFPQTLDDLVMSSPRINTNDNNINININNNNNNNNITTITTMNDFTTTNVSNHNQWFQWFSLLVNPDFQVTHFNTSNINSISENTNMDINNTDNIYHIDLSSSIPSPFASISSDIGTTINTSTTTTTNSSTTKKRRRKRVISITKSVPKEQGQFITRGDIELSKQQELEILQSLPKIKDEEEEEKLLWAKKRLNDRKQKQKQMEIMQTIQYVSNVGLFIGHNRDFVDRNTLNRLRFPLINLDVIHNLSHSGAMIHWCQRIFSVIVPQWLEFFMLHCDTFRIDPRIYVEIPMCHISGFSERPTLQRNGSFSSSINNNIQVGSTAWTLSRRQRHSIVLQKVLLPSNIKQWRIRDEKEMKKEQEYIANHLQIMKEDYWTQMYTLFVLKLLREWIMRFPPDHFRRVMHWIFDPLQDKTMNKKHQSIASYIQWNECNLWDDLFSNGEYEWIITTMEWNTIPNLITLWKYMIVYSGHLNRDKNYFLKAQPIAKEKMKLDWRRFDVVHCSHLLLENAIGRILGKRTDDYILLSFEIHKAIQLIAKSEEYMLLFKTYGAFLRHFQGSVGTDWSGLQSRDGIKTIFSEHVTCKQWSHWLEKSSIHRAHHNDITFEEIGQALQQLLGF